MRMSMLASLGVTLGVTTEIIEMQSPESISLRRVPYKFSLIARFIYFVRISAYR